MFSLHLDYICLPPPSMRNIFLQKEVLVLQETCSDFAPSQCVRALVVSTCCHFTQSADIAGIHRKPFLWTNQNGECYQRSLFCSASVTWARTHSHNKICLVNQYLWNGYSDIGMTISRQLAHSLLCIHWSHGNNRNRFMQITLKSIWKLRMSMIAFFILVVFFCCCNFNV